MIHNRRLTESEANSLADPSNVMLAVGGSPLLIPTDLVYPVYLPSGSTPAAAKPALWMGVCV